MSAFDITNASTPAHYEPSKTALLLLDFHSLFVVKLGPGAEEALKVASGMRLWAKSQGIHVIHALISLDATPLPTCKGIERLNGFLSAMKAEGGGEASLLLEGSTENEVTFTRTPGYVSALKSPGINEYLQEKGITSLILTGLSTSGCLMRTAIPATDEDHIVTVLSDGCADRDEEEHRVVLEKLLPTRAYVVTSQEFQEGYIKARA